MRLARAFARAMVKLMCLEKQRESAMVISRSLTELALGIVMSTEMKISARGLFFPILKSCVLSAAKSRSHFPTC